MPSIKPKTFSQFISKTINERVIKAQSSINEHFSKQKDIDSIMEHDASLNIEEGESSVLNEHVTVLAKCLEISDKELALMDSLINSSNNLKYVS
jgi:hypothetical protein